MHDYYTLCTVYIGITVQSLLDCEANYNIIDMHLQYVYYAAGHSCKWLQ